MGRGRRMEATGSSSRSARARPPPPTVPDTPPQPHEDSRDTEEESRRHPATRDTEPVYMPRSKYFRDEENSLDSVRPRAQTNNNNANDDDPDPAVFVGARRAAQVGKYLRPNEFCLYYQLPERAAPVPYRLRLYLAYMSSQNKEVFHFPVVCSKNARTGEDLWSLRYTESATFPSLAALIKYHRIYSYMDPNTGKIDTFPVWKGAIIDDESCD